MAEAVSREYIENHKLEWMISAYHVARLSPDPSTQNGAVIPLPGSRLGNQVVADCNHFPPGILPTPEQLTDRDWKLAHIEHAERAVIYRYFKLGFKGPPEILVCPFMACTDCARAIVMCGFRRVICHKERMDKMPDRWKKSVDAGLVILRAANVEIEVYSVKLHEKTSTYLKPILADGTPWRP